MTTDRVSMRQAARTLGVSQIRVRELIRKGTLEAEKVQDGAGERWEIIGASVATYLEQRERNGSSGAPAGQLQQLLSGLQDQLARIRTLVAEIERGQSYLDGLRTAQRAVEQELAAVERKLGAAPKPKSETPKSEKPKSEKPTTAPDGAGEPRAEQPTTEAEAKPQKQQKAPKPKAEKPKADKPKAADPAPDAPVAAEPERQEPAKAESPEPQEQPKPAKKPGKAKKAPAGKAERGKASSPTASEKSDGAKPSARSDTAMAAALRDAGVSTEQRRSKKAAKRPAKNSS